MIETITVKHKKPKREINSRHKFPVGILSLVLLLLFSLLMLERLKIPGTIFGIALIVCLVYFVFMVLIDGQTLQEYKLYVSELLEKVQKLEPEYEVEIPYYPKNIVLLLAFFMMLAIVALGGKGKIFSLISIILFVLFLAIYIYLENEEGKVVTRETEKLENKFEELNLENKMEDE